jgi:PKD repeat protein
MTRLRRILPLAALLALAIAPAAFAQDGQPPLDLTKVAYDPIGFFKPGDPLPADYGKSCETVQPMVKNGVFNPSGKFSAHDNSIYEVFCLPYRNQGDTNASDPMGNGGEPRHGYCAGAPVAGDITSADGAGTCPNHQLEFISYYQKTMQEILGDFGVTFQTYTYEQPDDSCTTPPCIGRDPAAIVVGADHPDQHILIGSHYDQTTSGPASVWDSQEGHAEMIRVAKIMADYWRSTGTRPSATIKFMPMDGEEDGLFGSTEYVNNVIPPDGENNMRGYWNADPCAGGYPAYHYGNRANRIDLAIQVGISDDPDVVKFNETVPAFVEAIFDRIDDKLETYPEQPEIIVSTAEGLPGIGGDIGRDVFIGTEHAVLFSSDWANFVAAGVPIFNPSPKVTGPQSSGETGPQSVTNPPEALYQFHTPLDNWQTINRYTGGDPTGNAYSEGYIKGMEFCSTMLAAGMLRGDQGGAQIANTKPIAYYEALPNEAAVKTFVNFDAGGSYQYTDVAKRTMVSPDELQYKWDFGDGSPTAFGVEVKHAYKNASKYQSKLTVTNRTTGESATMELPIVVEEGTGTDVDPAGQFVDPVPAKRSIVACQSTASFTKASVTPAGKGLKFDFATTAATARPTTIEVFLAGKGKTKRVAKFSKTAAFTWKGKKGLKKGSYFVRLSGVGQNGQREDRFFAFTLAGKFKKAKAFASNSSCELVSLFRLSAPAFGKSLAIGVVTTKAADVTVEVRKGKKVVKKFTAKPEANKALRFTLSGKKLKKGAYSVVLKATAAGDSKTATLYTKKL